MAIVKTGGGVTDIRGGFGGVYFTRDRSGLHSTAKPRRVHQQTAAQRKQRNAFIKARTYTKDPRWVSYYIYRALNNLPFIFDAIVTGNPVPDCTGKYELAGTYRDNDYYRKTDGAWFIWTDEYRWFVSAEVGVHDPTFWRREPYEPVAGKYSPFGTATGFVFVSLELTPPPVDYNPPGL